MDRPTRIGIVGDFDPAAPSHPATDAALAHAAGSAPLTATWLPTETLADAGAEARLEAFDGLWLAPRSPYHSTEGAHRALRFARARGRPLLAT